MSDIAAGAISRIRKQARSSFRISAPLHSRGQSAPLDTDRSKAVSLSEPGWTAKSDNLSKTELQSQLPNSRIHRRALDDPKGWGIEAGVGIRNLSMVECMKNSVRNSENLLVPRPRERDRFWRVIEGTTPTR